MANNLSSNIPDPKWDPETRNCTWKGQSRIGAPTRSQWFFCLVQIYRLSLPDGWKVRSLDGNDLLSESHPRSNSSSIKPPPPNPFGDNRNSAKPGKPRISDHPIFSFCKDNPIKGLHVASFSQSHDPNIERPIFLASDLLEMWGPTSHKLKEIFLY